MNATPARIPSKSLFLVEVRRILGRDDVDDETGFAELAPDSIVLMEIATYVGESVTEIEPGEILQCKTVGGLYRFITLGSVDRNLPT